MNTERKEKLVALGADALADALLHLSDYSKPVNEMIERLIATPKENAKRFKKKLSNLKRRTRFIDWREVADFAGELVLLLEDLKYGVTDPLTGVQLVAAYYEIDDAVLNICDDSSGMVGDTFRYDARELFKDYAVRCTDKEKIADIILKVCRKDDYGVRDALIHCAGECLPEPVIRSMIDTLQHWADEESEDFPKRHYLHLIESLAHQIKDPELFVKTRIASWGKLSTAGIIDIAQVYLDSGDPDTAHAWLQKIPANETFRAHERDKLQEKIYHAQGDTEKLTELLTRKFHAYYSTDTLNDLLAVTGEDKRADLIQEATARILSADRLRLSNVIFLTEIGKIDAAETCLLDRADQLDGSFYNTLPDLAKVFEAEKRPLAASLIYRSLIVSVLERGYTKAYSHGVRYLKKLDSLAACIDDWKTFDSHQNFKAQIKLAHGLKRSFWSKYAEKK